MKWDKYRRAVDAVEFSPDFTARTLSLLEARQKEPSTMKKLSMKTVLIAAALVAALAVTAGAAAMLLSPAQVASRTGNQTLAAAFARGDATVIDQTQTVGDYDVTLMGFLSGRDLTGAQWAPDMTYGVVAVARTDGTALEDDVPPVTITPLVEGYAPWKVNNWTLGGGYSSFLEEGIVYVLFQSGTVEPFADHRVYLAAYPGHAKAPGSEIFAYGADGTISYQPGQEGVLFDLPLDPAKADPAQVDAFLEDLFGDVDPTDPTVIADSAPHIDAGALSIGKAQDDENAWLVILED